jgi:AbrB family looped-hinge helix DNA binding protein
MRAPVLLAEGPRTSIAGIAPTIYLTFILPAGAMMANSANLTTTLSTKGQVILPAAIRRRRNWNAGTRLTVEETPEGVLLKPAPLFAPTTPEQVFGCLRYAGKPKTLEDMQAGIAAEVRRRHARGRY